MHRQARLLRKAAEEAGGKVRSEAACAGEVGVRGNERSAGTLHDDRREGLVGRRRRLAVRALRQPGRDCPAQRRAGSVDLGLRVVGVDLERDVETGSARELGQQVVEDGNARRDVRRAGAVLDAGAGQSSARSTLAPSARRRSSIRS